jgi:hypothetical protein
MYGNDEKTIRSRGSAPMSDEKMSPIALFPCRCPAQHRHPSHQPEKLFTAAKHPLVDATDNMACLHDHLNKRASDVNLDDL